MKSTTSRIFTLVFVLAQLILAACSNNTAPSNSTTQNSSSVPNSSTTLSSQSTSSSPSLSNAPSTEQQSQSISVDESAVSDEVGQYQGLTKEEWDDLQEQKTRFEAMSDEEKQTALESGTIACTKFIHLWWEESIDNTLIRHVGSEQFGTWVTERQANDLCADIYSFADHFSIDLETLTSLIRDNNLNEIYPIDKLEARYAFMSENSN